VLNPGDIALSAPEDQRTSLSVLTLNIWFDSGNWPARFALILEQIRALDPDIIGLQEVIQRATLDNQAQQLADSLGYYYYFGSVDPEDRDQRFGNAIVSRYPIEEANFRALQPLNAFRKAVHVRVRVDGNVVDVYNTHLHNPPDAGDTRRQQIAGILDFIEETNSGGVTLLMGDFNANPDWDEMEVAYEAFADVYPLFHANHLDPEHTTLNHHLGHQQRRIDYIFFEENERVTPLSAEVVLDQPDQDGVYPSDHFGVLAVFDILGDASEFVLDGLGEAVELQPGGTTTVSVAFAPRTVGPKEVILRVLDEEVRLTGEAYDATVRSFPWSEDFTGVDAFQLPFGWTSNAENWYVFNSSHAGGESPELVFWWQPVQQGRFYVATPPFETTGLDSLSVTFRHRVNNFGDPGIYTLRLVSLADDQEHVILEWPDPDNVAAELITINITRDEHGVGADRLQLAWVFEGASDNIVRWAIDDVTVGALPQLVVTPGEVDFEMQQVGTVSDSTLFTLTNIGGGTIELIADAIQITGEDAEHFHLDGPTEDLAIAGGDSVYVRVAFAPLDLGERTAYLTVGNVTVTLRGEGFDLTEHIERVLTLNLMRGGAQDDSEFNRVENPAPDEVNSSSEVVEFRRSQHGVPWGGFFANMPVPLDLTVHKYVYVDVLKPRISPLRFKVESGPIRQSGDREHVSADPGRSMGNDRLRLFRKDGTMEYHRVHARL
jgi:endonuclease/exonuclease/phosphatase family metal-dependent hydrolase